MAADKKQMRCLEGEDQGYPAVQGLGPFAGGVRYREAKALPATAASTQVEVLRLSPIASALDTQLLLLARHSTFPCSSLCQGTRGCSIPATSKHSHVRFSRPTRSVASRHSCCFNHQIKVVHATDAAGITSTWQHNVMTSHMSRPHPPAGASACTLSGPQTAAHPHLQCVLHAPSHTG